MLLAVIWMKLNAKRHLACGKARHNIARLGIPELYVAIIRGGQKV